jgi:hypothetical protein
MKKWKQYKLGESCPYCGDDIEVLTSCLEEDDPEDGQAYYDGDDARCAAHCGFLSAVSVDEDEAWIQDGNIDDLYKKEDKK